MTEDRMALWETLRKGAESEGGDFLRESLRWLIGALMEAEVSAQIGAERYAHSAERTTPRNGYRHRAWDARLGPLDVALPKLRSGSPRPLPRRSRRGRGAESRQAPAEASRQDARTIRLPCSSPAASHMFIPSLPSALT
jgi:transposase-like protein